MIKHQPCQLAHHLLDVMTHDIVPLTEKGVLAGNKLFGAALLNKQDLSLVMVETNNEIENPLWHGEMHLLKRFHERPESKRYEPKDLIFFSTHEPCSLCLSAITWAGFDNFYYFFTYEDSRDAFAIPHDLKILQEVFGIEDGAYRKSNEFWQSQSVNELIDLSPKEDQTLLNKKAQALHDTYKKLSSVYQNHKDDNNIPLS